MNLSRNEKDNERPSPKSMGKILKLGIDVPQQAVRDYSVDSGSAVSESSEEKSSNKSSMDDGQMRLPSKKRKINYVMEQRDNSSMDSDLPSKKARVANKGSGSPAVPLPKKIITVRRRSEATMVSDGCQWRKYGQKMTMNNLWPRAYFRCAVPSCGIKKQVQRCDKDPSIVITTYKGEHNHLLSPLAIATMNDASDELKPSGNSSIPIAGNQMPFPASIATTSSVGLCPTITLDFTHNANTNPNRVKHSIHPQLPPGGFLQHLSPLLSEAGGYSKIGPDPVASTKADPHFTGALAAVIADSMLKLGVRLWKGYPKLRCVMQYTDG